MMKFSNIREVRIHLDPDPRQEWNMHENDMLRDTPKVYEDKIRALIKRKCPDVLGVTEMVLLYEQSGFVSVRINIILHPSLSIAEANDISTLICRAIRQESVLRKDRFPIRDIDIDLELSELMEKEKGLVIVPEDKVKNWVVGSSFVSSRRARGHTHMCEQRACEQRGRPCEQRAPTHTWTKGAAV